MTSLERRGTAPLVLVADDEDDLRSVICDLLAEAGFRTVAAPDGDQVEELARRHRPALIVMDVMMPRLDGYATVTRLAGDPSTRHIPVIMLTGQAGPVYRTLSFCVGAKAHLTKPFSSDQLLATVRQILGTEPG